MVLVSDPGKETHGGWGGNDTVGLYLRRIVHCEGGVCWVAGISRVMGGEIRACGAVPVVCCWSDWSWQLVVCLIVWEYSVGI